MSLKYCPQLTEIVRPTLVCRRLRSLPEYHVLFEEAVLGAIAGDYDDITPTFVKNLIAIDAQDCDPNGYITLGKEVWVVFDKQDELVGFEVITRKRGGSIKLGPTFITPDKRGQGWAKIMIETIVESYREAGARKVYVTAPLSNAATAGLDLKHLELQLEALLVDHYKLGSTERICGRFLHSKPKPPVTTLFAGYNTHSSVCCVSGFGQATQKQIGALLYRSMQHDYEDVDDSFVRAVFAGAEQSRQAYEHKPKIVHTLFSAKQVVGAAIIAPKRGGTYKVAPFAIDPEFRSKESIRLLLDACLHTAIRDSRSKLSLVVPVRDCNIVDSVLQAGFYAEGILRSPYKEGSDMVILSRKLAV